MPKIVKSVTLAKTAGFCWGVKRAMDITLDTAKKIDGPVYTHGPLIHNPQVIEMLEGKEVFAVSDATGIESGETMIIRTHGVTPHVRNEIKNRGLALADATCPLVAKVQGIIKKGAKRGDVVVIIGDAGHAEVVGLQGYATAGCHVINSVEQVFELPSMENISVVSQTTCDTTRYDGIVAALQKRYPGAVVHNTICDATEERQGEVLELARSVEAMVVVGGRNSANTRRLATLSEETGADVFLIETEEELDLALMGRYDSVGVTAGASTPTWMIERVTQSLEAAQRESAPTLYHRVRRLIEILLISNISIATGSAFMTLVSATLADFRFTWVGAHLAASYVFSMYALNQLNDVTTLKHNEPEKIRFYLSHKRIMTTLAFVTAGSAMVLAFVTEPMAGLLYLGALGLGFGYTIKWFPKNRLLRIHRLKDIPASKDIFVGLAWVMTATVIPATIGGGNLTSPALWVAAFFTFTLVYIRAVLSDIRDIEGDRMVGRETIPILIGKPATKIFLAVMVSLAAALLVLAHQIGWTGAFGLWLIASILYTGAYLLLYHRRILSDSLRFDLMVDGVFHFSGLLAVVWWSFDV